LEWARARSDRYSQVRALLTLAQAYAMQGDFPAARRHVAEQRALCGDVSLELVDAVGAFERSQVELLAGDLAAAEAEARSGCDFLQRKNEKAVLPTLQAELADILYARGEIDEAERMAEQARSLSAPDDSLTEMKWRAVLAKVRARRGDKDEAVGLAREAAAIGATTGYVDRHAWILKDLGDVLSLAGREDEATAAYADAASLFARKGNVVGRQLVDESLGDVHTSPSEIV
ncbi:MAG: tetratricopeptide repeat protein, partial [Actinomycetota bacterium]|nr:tetratricopeptide repeat protein [Actinomycetota bacterium]